MDSVKQGTTVNVAVDLSQSPNAFGLIDSSGNVSGIAARVAYADGSTTPVDTAQQVSRGMFFSGAVTVNVTAGDTSFTVADADLHANVQAHPEAYKGVILVLVSSADPNNYEFKRVADIAISGGQAAVTFDSAATEDAQVLDNGHSFIVELPVDATVLGDMFVTVHAGTFEVGTKQYLVEAVETSTGTGSTTPAVEPQFV